MYGIINVIQHLLSLLREIVFITEVIRVLRKNVMFSRIVILLVILLLVVFSNVALASDMLVAEERAQVLHKLDLFSGVDTNVFNPYLEGDTNRVQAMIMIARSLNWINASDWDDTALSGYTDVPSWAEQYVAYAVKKGVTYGIGNNLFGSTDVVTQRQLTTWFDRALGKGETWEKNVNLDNTNALIRVDLVNGIWDLLAQTPVGEEFTLIESVIGDNQEFAEIVRNSGMLTDGQINDGEHHDEEVYENVVISASVDNNLVGTGGGHTVQITAYVTHNGKPAAGVPVGFFAFKQITGQNRDQQITDREVVTGVDGKAHTTYTTLATDDNDYIVLNSNTRDDADEHGWQLSNSAIILASKNASQIQGRVLNPFTGEPFVNADIGFGAVNSQEYIYIDNSTDNNGWYSFPILSGVYYIAFNFDMQDQIYYTGSYKGSHSQLGSDNVAILRFNKFTIGQNKNYTLDTEVGVLKGTVNNLGSNRSIYITKKGTNITCIADVNADNSFMILISEGTYEITNSTGHILRNNVVIRKGEITDLGTFSR